MGRMVLDGNPPLELTLRRSPRARRISLRVSDLDGRVTLTLPVRADVAEGLAFAEEKRGWIDRAQARRAPTLRPGIGDTLPVAGRPREIRAGPKGPARLTEDAIFVAPDPTRLGARLRTLLRDAARVRVHAAVAVHAAALGRRHGRVTLRDTRSRWGSCSSKGDLMISWRLILAPEAVLYYVVAHEVAHLAEMNHSPAFWATVARLCPDHADPRAWLRTHGAGLHRYVFSD